MGVDKETVRREVERVRKVAAQGGYRLHPDTAFVEELVAGYLVNRERYGYDSCPCRLATGDVEKDRAIVCPCVYRDDDLANHDACYCALYVTDDFQGEDNPPVPERWDPDAVARPVKALAGERGDAAFVPVKAHVCQVCGYVAVKDTAPRICPVCGVTADRFTPVQLAMTGIGGA